jgi:tetratricopeptide (TPR) repeat protein
MILNWLDASRAVELGIALADELAPPATDATHRSKSKSWTPNEALQEILERPDLGIPTADLNFYKRAKLANSFKWRLIENGVERVKADEVTQTLVLNLSINRPDQQREAVRSDGPRTARPAPAGNAQQLLLAGNKCMARGQYLEASEFFHDILKLDPNNAIAFNNLGSAYSRLNRFQEAEECFRSAVVTRPDFVAAHCNLGMVLRWRGYLADSEISLRQALKLNPRYLDARINLGMTLALSNRFRDAAAHFKKVLKTKPRDPEALFGMGQIAGMEGRFEESEKIFKQALAVDPKMPIAWAALVNLRKMTTSDPSWLASVEEIVANKIPPMESATLHFAMGKYYDDLAQFEHAFKKYRSANEQLKPISDSYDRKARTHFVDKLMRLPAPPAADSVPHGANASKKPVLVVGMMRSGTSLTEQIIASHPLARGAGELEYWHNFVRERFSAPSLGLDGLDLASRTRIAEGYLRALEGVSPTALRVVDKAPLNAEYLGVIHSILPNARFIHMQRDPIDTCLSCYFQNFSLAHSFTLDLPDLAHYYREHHRLVSHLRNMLPRGSILDVPYEELVADQEGWTRKILDFIELEWDARCLDFPATQRPIVTASFWQARQKIFKTSVQRWRNYEKFIEPLLELKQLHY